MQAWLLNQVLRNPQVFLAIRNDDAFLIANTLRLPWTDEPTCEVLFICAEEGAIWQALDLTRASVRWGRERRTWRWRISSETDYELGPLAKRLGARAITSRYELKL